MDKKYLIHAMGSIAWGYVFFYLAINLGTIDILPDWVLFVMVVRALEPLSEVVHSAKVLEPLGILLGFSMAFSGSLRSWAIPSSGICLRSSCLCWSCTSTSSF